MLKEIFLYLSHNISHFLCPNPSHLTILTKLQVILRVILNEPLCEDLRLHPKNVFKCVLLATIMHNLIFFLCMAFNAA